MRNVLPVHHMHHTVLVSSDQKMFFFIKLMYNFLFLLKAVVLWIDAMVFAFHTIFHQGKDVFYTLTKSLMGSANRTVVSILTLVRAVLMTTCRMNARLCLHISVFPVLRV